VSDEPQRVLVTGASRGIGQACAVAFARDGARVAINHPDDDEAARETEQLVREAGGDPLLLSGDVSSSADVDGMLAEIRAAFGGIDVVVLNAGICPWQDFWDISRDDWEHVMAVNLTSQFLIAQAFGREMVDAGKGGRIISVASLNAHVAGARQAHYAASKGGVVAFLKTLAVILGPHGITCNSVSPGPIATQINQYQGIPGKQDQLEQQIPVRRIGRPMDVAEVVRSIASPAWSFVNGADLVVDGGILVNPL
jgi:L-rhamnose 1-dehydrogenase